MADAGAAGEDGSCDHSLPFGIPMLLEGANSPADESLAWQSADGLTLYFGSMRSGEWDVYRATRGSASEAFGAPIALPAPVNGPTADGDPELTSDGLAMFFSRDDDIFVATRPTLLGDFTDPVPLSNVNSDAGDWAGSVSGDGQRLYFQSSRTGPSQIYLSMLGPSGSFEPPTAVGELNTTDSQSVSPTTTPDALTMYFGSTRSVAGAKGDVDIFVAHRSTVNDGFGSPVLVAELNTESMDMPSWVSPDDCQIILVSRRQGGPGERDYYVAERPK